MPTVPLVNVVLVILIAALFTVTANDCVVFALALSVTLTVSDDEPEVVGVPEITPLVLKVKPDGNVPEVTVQV